jgi:3-methyladenine DNA glycosylase AlkD
VLKDGGSAPHAEGVQRFFKEEIQSRGWYTRDERKLAARFRRALLNGCGLDYMVQVADNLFQGDVLEEKAMAVYLVEKSVAEFGDREFKLFESWLDRISSWADHDALVSYLIANMIVAEPRRAARVFKWAKSPDRWHRRAACVALHRGTRRQMFFDEITRLTELLLSEKDDMVQKGLGWLLRETVKYNREPAVPFIMRIRERLPRLVLRTACETLPVAERRRILARNK